MTNFSIKFKNINELKEFINNHKIYKYESVLIQIFTGVLEKGVILDILNFLSKKLPKSVIIGASTDGEIYNAEVLEKSIVISFTCFEKTTLKSHLVLKDNKSDYEVGKELIENIYQSNTKVVITFCSGIGMNGEYFIKGVESKNKDFIISGGMAGDNAIFKETFVFDNDTLIKYGAVGVSLNSEELIAYNKFGFNWQGIGKIMTITKSKDNVVYEINGQSALDTYRFYLGESVAQNLPAIGIEFPLVIKRGFQDIARAVIEKNEDGSLVFAGNLQVGDKVQFAFGNVEAILSKTTEVLKSIKDLEAQSVFVYSCMARRRFLGDKIKYEIEPFKQFGEVNGFFTYGEFFGNKETTELFNQTMTILMLSETDEKKHIHIENKLNFKEDDYTLTLNALSHLVNVTSRELADINENLEEKVKLQTQKLKAKNLELEYMYYHDKLTGLENKNAFYRDIKENEIDGCLLIDIKKFSSINDIYDDFIGDEVLKLFSKELDKFLDNSKNSYRVGIDQFMITSEKEINYKEYAKSIIEYFLNNPIHLVSLRDNIDIKIDLSVRIVVVRGIESVLFQTKADMALKYLKEKGEDYIFYDKNLGLEEKIENEVKVISMVKKAIKENRIVPVFQRIKKHNMDSFECLVRIKDNHKLISPFEFLDIIKNTRYYFDITKIMIVKSFEYFKNREENFSINFSFKDIINDEIVNFLIEKIKIYNMYDRVIIELLESENLDSCDVVNDFINKIREYGVKIAIDDFGSGYSNFNYLVKLKPDFIKIDGSLIKNIDNDRNSYIITKNINNFAKELGCNTVAEYVHSKDVLKVLKKLKIDGLQGFYIEKPKEEI